MNTESERSYDPDEDPDTDPPATTEQAESGDERDQAEGEESGPGGEHQESG